MFINRFLPPEVSLEGQVLVAAGVTVDADASGAAATLGRTRRRRRPTQAR